MVYTASLAANPMGILFLELYGTVKIKYFERNKLD